MKKLTNKQLKFIDEYMIDLNATAAYVRAGYSKKLANTNATKLLQNTTISDEIDRRKKELAKEAKITREDIVDRLNKRSKLVEEMQALASKDKLTSAEESKLARLMMVIRTSDANKSDEILNKMLGFNEPEKTEVTHKGLTINYIKPKDKKKD